MIQYIPREFADAASSAQTKGRWEGSLSHARHIKGFWIYIRISSVVFLFASATSAQRESGYSPLLPRQLETTGYGLYSYVLLDHSNAGEKQRNIGVLSAFLELLVKLNDLESFFPRHSINITYVPVKSAVPAPLAASPDWVLANYDFGRAKYLLSKLPGSHRKGPYIISVTIPLSTADGSPSRYLLQDLSPVPPRLIAAWSRAFIEQAAQERFWETGNSKSLILRIRTRLGQAGDELKDTMEKFVFWTSSGSK